MGVIRNRSDRLARHRARRFRATPSYVEKVLWALLRDRGEGWKWRRQVPVGRYIVDFFCVEAALIVELDGEQHTERASYDARRDGYLRSLGLRVLRIRNEDFLSDTGGVVAAIRFACREAASGRGTLGRRPVAFHCTSRASP